MPDIFGRTGRTTLRGSNKSGTVSAGSGSIQGAAELQKLLGELERKVSRKIARQTLRSAAKIVQKEVESRAKTISSRLGAERHPVRTAKGLKRGQIGIQINQPRREKLGIPEDDKYYWPAVVEFGARNVGRRNARPYMRPALAAKEKEVIAHASKTLRDEIIKASRV